MSTTTPFPTQTVGDPMREAFWSDPAQGTSNPSAGVILRPGNKDLEPTNHEFRDQCESLTITLGYLALSSSYDRWVISGVPDAKAMTPFGLRRPTNVIDVLHDRGIWLDSIIVADFTVAPHRLPPPLHAPQLASPLNSFQSPDTESATA